MTSAQIARLIERRRLPLTDEKRCQEALAVEFAAAGILAEREVNLGDGDIIDFMIGNIGLEIKLSGQRRAIYRQCKRYVLHARVSSLVLATNAAMGLPALMNSKDVTVVSLARGWL